MLFNVRGLCVCVCKGITREVRPKTTAVTSIAATRRRVGLVDVIKSRLSAVSTNVKWDFILRRSYGNPLKGFDALSVRQIFLRKKQNRDHTHEQTATKMSCAISPQQLFWRSSVDPPSRCLNAISALRKRRLLQSADRRVADPKVDADANSRS
jgi:hypothetical protein